MLSPALQASKLGLTQAQAMDFAVQHRLKYETPRQREERRRKYSRMMEDWKLTVGYKIHVQLKSKYKMFSTAVCDPDATPNTSANFTDMGLPGMLPVLNEHCLNQAIKASLALGGRILPQIKFDRKHYTYCDLPQAYQITQQHYPIMLDGRLFYYDYKDQENYVLIERVQMEQVRAHHPFDYIYCCLGYRLHFREGRQILHRLQPIRYPTPPN